MRKIIGFLKQRWLVSFLGLLAMVLLIWFAGPFVAFAGRVPLESANARYATIAVVVSIWALIQLRRYWLAKRNNSQILEGIVGDPSRESHPTDAASAEELATLRQRLEEAMAVLKKSRLGNGRGRKFLYQLPWYIIIGPPGAGKTTALVNSGLNFPLEDRFGAESIRGVGGTRNCDWWFTDEAVLIDTAGRYTTQDSHQELDRAAWTGFLDLLKKHRRRRPINGALIAISVLDLMQQTEAERAAHARAIKQRVQELHEQLGVRFPIYVLFTKCDLLAGFVEFFADFGRDQRAQVWGMTFGLEPSEKPEGAVAGFAREFAGLERRLNDRVVERLQQERDSERRDLIYAFPKQFSALSGVAEGFLNDVFQPSRFLEKPMLRGVYFTSGTQEGTPLDRITGTLAATFGLDRETLPSFSGTGKSYFITRLFRDVIFAEAGLAGTNLRLERQRVWLQRGVYAGTLGLVALGAVAWLTSYTQNRTYVADVANRASESQKATNDPEVMKGDFMSVLQPLNAVRSIPGGYDDRDRSTPWLMGLGLYQGEKLGSAARRTYDRLLVSLLMRSLMLRLENQLRQPRVPHDYRYATLKVYLMFDDTEYFDADTVRAWFYNDWEKNLPREATTTQREQLKAHLDTLLMRPPEKWPAPPDGRLVRNVRAGLVQVPLAKRVYAQLKRDGIGQGVPDFRITDAAGEDAPLVFKRPSRKPLNAGVEGDYTYRAYFQEFLPKSLAATERVAKESWVLGEDRMIASAAGRKRLIAQVERLYLEDYVQSWDTLLNDISIVPFTSLPHAVEVLNILAGAGAPSPLRRLLEGVAKETALDRPPQQAATLMEKAGETASGIIERIKKAAGSLGVTQPEMPAALVVPPNRVTTRYGALHREVRARGEAPPPIERTVRLIEELYISIYAVARAAGRGDIMEVAKSEVDVVLQRMELEARRKPPPLNEWLRTLTSQSYTLVGDRAARGLNATWVTTVVPFCRRALMGRYPLDRGSQREVTVEDFSRFFAPDGLMDQFFQQHLAQYVDTSARAWRVRETGGVNLRVSPAALRAFQQAAVIRETFFSDGGNRPSVRFWLKPVSMDASISSFVLDVEGQRVSYRHGPVRGRTLQWPGPEGLQQVRIQVSPPSAGNRSGWTRNGPWAWFRLLDEAQIVPSTSPEMFQINFDLDGRSVVYQLRSSSAFNPFQLKELEQFRCPENL